MMRKLFVNALALLAVLAVAGGAMAAVSHDADADKERPAAQVAAKEAQRARQAAETTDTDDDAEDVDAEQAAQVTDEGDESTEGDGFGAARSAEVAAYHECRDAAADDDDEAGETDATEGAEADAGECEKPGPAWENDAHPVFGTDGAKAGEKPAEGHRKEAGAQRPERAAKGKAHGKPSR